MKELWQHLPEHISPTIFTIGPFQLRYYGLMYLVAFSIVYILVLYRLKTEDFRYEKTLIQDCFVWLILGLMIGARIGYVLFYNLRYYLSHPLEIILPFSFEGGLHFTGLAGMSYHGGLVGVIISAIIFCYKRKIDFWDLSDLFVPTIPLAYTFGRIGNFLNGELYGRITDVPWGMYFPLDSTHQLRHPSQLYEAFFEGIFLFLVLWSIRRKRPFKGFFIPLYLIGYGTVRFFIEFFREPDPQLGFIIGFLTMGQILCLVMILSGIILIYYRKPSI
jgi:phosphatidylglycerol:prolipoprotein diacylglycerol transferase